MSRLQWRRSYGNSSLVWYAHVNADQGISLTLVLPEVERAPCTISRDGFAIRLKHPGTLSLLGFNTVIAELELYMPTLVDPVDAFVFAEAWAAEHVRKLFGGLV